MYLGFSNKALCQKVSGDASSEPKRKVLGSGGKRQHLGSLQWVTESFVLILLFQSLHHLIWFLHMIPLQWKLLGWNPLALRAGVRGVQTHLCLCSCLTLGSRLHPLRLNIANQFFRFRFCFHLFSIYYMLGAFAHLILTLILRGK